MEEELGRRRRQEPQFFFMWMDKTIDGELNRTCLKADPIFLWSNACFSCIDGVAGIMPIITCPSCNLTNTRFCREKGFVENIRFCCKTGFAIRHLFGFVWCRLLCRHLGFDSDFAQISGLQVGG